MARTRIQLTKAQIEALRARASAGERRRRALASVGMLGKSKGPRDLSRRHDDYLAEAYQGFESA